MAESTIGIDDGTDKFLHTDQRTIAATAKEEQYVLQGEQTLPTYSAIGSAVATTTSASHMIMIMGDGTLYTRIRRIFIEQVAGATAATLAVFQGIRLSTAGSGGGAVTESSYDTGDTTPYAGITQTLPSSKGTEGTFLWQRRMQLLTTAQVAAATVNPTSVEWIARPNMKPIIIGPAITDGFCIKIVTGIATSTVDITLEFTTSTYL